MDRDRSIAAKAVSGQPDTTPRWYTVAEYAKLTRRCPASIRQHIRQGRIEAVRSGLKYLIPVGAEQRELVPAQRGAATSCPGDGA
jgi:Helix-turn-helix domain